MRIKMDNPVIKFFEGLGDLIVINILTLILCLPVVTAGAAITAMYSVCMKIVRKEEPYIFKSYFKSFKVNFKQSTLLWLIMLGVAAILVADALMLPKLTGSKFALYVVLVLAFAFLFITANVFPMQAHFVNPIKTTLKNSVLLAFGLLPQSFSMALMNVIPFVICYVWDKALPAFFLIGLSGAAFINCAIITEKYKRYEPEEEKDPDYVTTDRPL